MLDIPEAEEREFRPLRITLVGVSLPETNTATHRLETLRATVQGRASDTKQAREAGLVGSTVYNRLSAVGHYVSVLTRFPVLQKFAEVSDTVFVYPDGLPLDAFLEGSDAVVSVLPMFYVEEQRHVVQAAIVAGIERFIAIEPGFEPRHCPSAALRYTMTEKSIQPWLELVAGEAGMAYTLIYTGICLDPGEQDTALVNIQGKFVYIYGDGDTPFGATISSDIARAIATALEKPRETRNRCLRIQSLVMNQSSLLHYVEACIGEDGWQTTNLTMEQLVESFFGADGRLSRILRTQEGVSRFGIVCNHSAEDPDSVRHRENDNELLGVRALNPTTAEGIMLSYIRYVIDPGFPMFPIIV